MQPHQQRVVEERDQLNDKITKLASFMAGSIYSSLDEAEQERLERQYSHMMQYALVLEERINAF